MKSKFLFRAACAAFCLFLTPFPQIAMAEVPCLVFTGNSGDEAAYDLAEYNRVAFGNEAMTLTSSVKPANTPMELLYSEFNRFMVRNAVPTSSDAIEAEELSSFGVIYISASNEVGVKGILSEPAHLSIYNAAGIMVGSATVNPGERVSLANSPAGIYMVVATSGAMSDVCKIVK